MTIYMLVEGGGGERGMPGRTTVESCAHDVRLVNVEDAYMPHSSTRSQTFLVVGALER